VKQIDNNAIKHLKLSLEIDSEYVPSLFLLAKIYINNEQYELAKSNLDKIEQIDCENNELLFLNSKLAFKKKDYKRAKEFIDSCFSKKHFTKEALQLALDLATIQKSNNDKVMILENWILHHNPGYEKYLELAKSLDQPNQYEQAKYYFEVARDLKTKRCKYSSGICSIPLFRQEGMQRRFYYIKSGFSKSEGYPFRSS
jgi:tetratricopeptide (TPR) repeat protein